MKVCTAKSIINTKYQTISENEVYEIHKKVYKAITNKEMDIKSKSLVIRRKKKRP